MLTYLHVKNLALIDEVEVEFGPGLNILTGETGAGKSILMGAVNLALGQKMSRDMLRHEEEPALVELIFHVEEPELIQKLQKNEFFLEDGQVIFSRKLTGNRSISRVNGEICTASQIREMASLLLDIHGQHEHQSLLYHEKQLDILDSYGKAGVIEQKEFVKKEYQKYQAIKEELKQYQLDEEARKREISFLEYEIHEITEANLRVGEDEELEKQYQRIVNGKRILESLGAVENYTDSDQGAADQIGRAMQEISRIENFDPAISQISEMLSDVESLLHDINHEITSYVNEISFSEEEYYEVEQRLNVLNHLKSKYGASVQEVLAYGKEKQAELDRLVNFEERKNNLESLLEKQKNKLEETSRTLSELRKEAAVLLEKEICQGLSDLNFLEVKFHIDFQRTESYSANGNDRISFKISTNPGEPVRPLAKVVSGGELSRIMLAMKTIMADKDETGTLIFDEIDTGISGRTAQKVSEKMAVIGKNHQVLCITHLPQIAAMADQHFEIVKSVQNGVTHTQIHKLNEKDSVMEIARILGGAEITEQTMASAAEMKKLAFERKKMK